MIAKENLKIDPRVEYKERVEYDMLTVMAIILLLVIFWPLWAFLMKLTLTLAVWVIGVVLFLAAMVSVI